MFIQVTKEEFSTEILKKAWHQTNIIVFTIALLYPLLCVVDYLYVPALWLQFFIVRLVISLAIYALHGLFQRKQYDYRLLLHISLLLISITSAALCSLVNIGQLSLYFLLYSLIILFFNLQVFWEPVNSIIQALVAFLLILICYKAFSHYDLNLFISKGGQFFALTTALSCLIPNAQYRITERYINSRILIEKSTDLLKEQRHDLNEKDKLIDLQYEQLRKLNDHKNSFINIAGHDLKNLIGSIIMSSVLIQEENYRLSTEQKEYINYITESADKMQYLLSKLVNVKEIDSNEINFNLEIFDINTEVNQVVKGLNETALTKNINLVNNISNRPLHVRLDKVFAGQVFQNLLSNAIKFSQLNNTLLVTTSLQAQKFVFEIIDEGVAIGQHELDWMFDKLKTLNDASTSKESRLGLGLSIAKLMTKEMGGELSYRSNADGNYFRVEFFAMN
ncbi:Histidine kinase-, DNA gyrase B-, and HSP90-like ATPase [Mucilaginibacter mallensis]|uniref:histidine kinase n=1 Tax=Mucilaginibacter mallensis TaxID=652787 RepID=A0A1H2AXA8_MUCMA|nr:HAMP domain-containing sensor histidine kinase [Mucilaginibacter mallensis]SDT50176.1 Histidine kinase-, DNA gyrase B-, and HSP90-like ATPase [Mucilaginibacter mallensis]